MDKNNTSSSTSLPCGEQQIAHTFNFTRYFIIKRTDSTSNSSFKNTSPFLIAKTFQSVLGEVRSIRKLKSGDLMVEVSSASQSEILSKCSTIGTFSVSVETHRTLNSSRGVISAADLLYSTKEELLENLKNQNVIDVRRITIKKNDQVLPTKHIILTFNSTTLPNKIKAAYLSCPVRPYIPNPLRCFKCQRYGHAKTSCRGSVTCARCAEVGHDSEGCDKPERCINCRGEHPAYSRYCTKWIQEKEILAVKINQNLTYPEARKIIESRTPSIGTSYSNIVKLQQKSVCDASTQTLPAVNPVSRKTTHNKCLSCETRDMPPLRLLPHSSEPVTIEYSKSPPKKSKLPTSSSKNNSVIPETSHSNKNPPSVTKTTFSSQNKFESNKSNSKQARAPSSAPQSSQKPVPTNSKQLPAGPQSIRSIKTKQKTSPLRPPFAKFKGSKRLHHFVEEAMESEAHDHDSDYSDLDDNTMFEITEPN